MDIGKIREDLAKEGEYLSEKDNIQAYFDNQVQSIVAISNTEGYNQIRGYWARELNRAFQILSQCDINDTKAIALGQAKSQLAESFLTFLDNLIIANNLTPKEKEELEE